MLTYLPPAARHLPGTPLLLVSGSTCGDSIVSAASKCPDRDPTCRTPSFQEQELFQQQQLLAWPPREDAAGEMSPSVGTQRASSNGGWLMGPGSLASSAAEEGERVIARLRADMRALEEVCSYKSRHSLLLCSSTTCEQNSGMEESWSSICRVCRCARTSCLRSHSIHRVVMACHVMLFRTPGRSCYDVIWVLCTISGVEKEEGGVRWCVLSAKLELLSVLLHIFTYTYMCINTPNTGLRAFFCRIAE